MYKISLCVIICNSEVQIDYLENTENTDTENAARTRKKYEKTIKAENEQKIISLFL